MTLRLYAPIYGIATAAARSTRSSSADTHRASAGALRTCKGGSGPFTRDRSQTRKRAVNRLGGRYPSMGHWLGGIRRRRGMWALPEPSAVVLWQFGIAWSSVAAVVDASTGRRMVLSGLVLLGPVWVFFTGRWLRTAVAGEWATCLVAVLGVPDGIWGSRLETFLITLAVVVAALGTLALVVTVRASLSLTVTASLAAACGNPGPPTARRPAVSAARPVSCRQQYQDWEHGPGFAQYGRLRADVRTVRAAEKSRNRVALRSARSARRRRAPARSRRAACPTTVGPFAGPSCFASRDVPNAGVLSVGQAAPGALEVGGNRLRAGHRGVERQVLQHAVLGEQLRHLLITGASQVPRQFGDDPFQRVQGSLARLIPPRCILISPAAATHSNSTRRSTSAGNARAPEPAGTVHPERTAPASWCYVTVCT